MVKRILLVLALLLLMALFAFGHSDAGFLDSELPGGGVWGGAGWYCIDRASPWDLFDDYSVAGPFGTQPTQQFCNQF